MCTPNIYSLCLKINNIFDHFHVCQYTTFIIISDRKTLYKPNHAWLHKPIFCSPSFRFHEVLTNSMCFQFHPPHRLDRECLIIKIGVKNSSLLNSEPYKIKIFCPLTLPSPLTNFFE
jgi:hypothetical protein